MAQATGRDLLAEILVGSLTAVAFEEMVHTARAATGDYLVTLCLAVIFAATTIRFLVGNLLYLISPKAPAAGLPWFVDLLVIILEGAVLAFLGGFCTAESKDLSFSFIGVLSAVLVIDVCWMLYQWARRSQFEAWPWFWLNVSMLAFIALLYAICGSMAAYSRSGILALLAANLIAFVVDIRLLRRHNFLQFLNKPIQSA